MKSDHFDAIDKKFNVPASDWIVPCELKSLLYRLAAYAAGARDDQDNYLAYIISLTFQLLYS